MTQPVTRYNFTICTCALGAGETPSMKDGGYVAYANYLALAQTARELVRQLYMTNPVDDHGHPVKNFKALHDLQALLATLPERTPE